jgi:hypothetical protein
MVLSEGLRLKVESCRLQVEEDERQPNNGVDCANSAKRKEKKELPS